MFAPSPPHFFSISSPQLAPEGARTAPRKPRLSS
jgi:hypothetical protein